MSKKILLNKADIVKSFVKEAMKLSGDVNLISSTSKEYVVNGKSILGIYSLDLSKPVLVETTENNSNFNNFLKTIEV